VNQVTVAQPLPSGFPERLREGSLNAAMANALSAGDQRYHMKRLDRAGFSRGGAQANQAGIGSAQALSDGIADAYQQALRDRQADSMSQLRGQVDQEKFAQSLGALQQQNAYANAQSQLQRQGALMGLLNEPAQQSSAMNPWSMMMSFLND